MIVTHCECLEHKQTNERQSVERSMAHQCSGLPYKEFLLKDGRLESYKYGKEVSIMIARTSNMKTSRYVLTTERLEGKITFQQFQRRHLAVDGFIHEQFISNTVDTSASVSKLYPDIVTSNKFSVHFVMYLL